MASVLDRDKSAGRRFLGIGWVLVVVDLIVTGLAIYSPFYLSAVSTDPLFFLDEWIGVCLGIQIGISAALIFMVVQAFFIPRLARRLRLDAPEVAAGEAALKLARLVAIGCGLILVFYTVTGFRTYKSWSDNLRFLREIQEGR
jgi:hypothetical protein